MSTSGSETEGLDSDDGLVEAHPAIVVASSSDSDRTVDEETVARRGPRYVAEVVVILDEEARSGAPGEQVQSTVLSEPAVSSPAQIVVQEEDVRNAAPGDQAQGSLPSERIVASQEIVTGRQGRELLSTSLDDFQAGSRKRKKQPSESADDKDEDQMENESCPICFEEWTNAGQHRLASLKCGHLFGLSCIERWIRSNSTCPQCKAKSRRSDIRFLYASKLKVLDTAERDKALQLLEEERRHRRHAEEAAAQLQLQNQLLKQECNRMRMQLQELQQASSSGSSGGSHRNHEVASATGAAGAPTVKQFVPFKNIAVAQSQARVVDFERSNAMLLVSRPSAPANQLFRGSGILKISLHDTRHTQYVNIHSQRLRDIAVSSRGDALALTASEDKTLRLTSLVSNAVVQKYDVPSPAWSCCWHSEEDYYFFAGLMNGRVLLFDVRNTTQHVGAVGENGDGAGGLGAGPAVSIVHVKPSVVASSCRSSGLLVGQSTRLSFCRHVAGADYGWSVLLQGSVTSVSWEGKTRHGLVSLRPGKAHSSVKHALFQLAEDRSLDEPTVSLQMVGSMVGGSTARLLSRSTVFQHPEHSEHLLACAGDESAKAALLYDCSSERQLQKLTCLSAGQKEILHVRHFQHRNDDFLATLTETNLGLFRWAEP